MHVFVSAVVAGECKERADHQFPTANAPRQREHGQHSQKDEQRAVPPCHWNDFFVRLMDDMIGVVGFENVMMHFCMRVERVGEIPEWPVH